MYEHLRGKLAAKSPSEAAVECGGVGYRVLIPLSTFEKLPEPGADCRLLVHLHVAEGVLALYGFATPEERAVFQRVISISGIGPKLALSVLSGMRVGELARAVAEKDVSAVRRIKGVGEKTASRMLLELAGVLDDILLAEADRAPARSRHAGDAVRALVNLGYQRKPAEGMVDRAVAELGESAPVEELIRAALGTSG
jgi:Holliday junction DNA helicase RuvA